MTLYTVVPNLAPHANVYAGAVVVATLTHSSHLVVIDALSVKWIHGAARGDVNISGLCD